MRVAYIFLTVLLTPIYAAYWFFRGIVNKSYWDRFGQRFGLGYPNLSAGCIWVHAVSVGEVQAAAPLIRRLMKRFSHYPVLVTTVTPTGAERVRLLFGDTVYHSYIPFETPNTVKQFFNSVNPRIALVMETEIWPNLYNECGRRKIPLVLVSARISPKSVKRYRRFLPLFRETLSHGIVIAAQSKKDEQRFLSLGAAAERTYVTGNIKFDIELSGDLIGDGLELRRNFFKQRKIWVAASTHDKEEIKILRAHRLVRKHFPDSVLVLIPRHPERFPAVKAILKAHSFNFISWTDKLTCDAQTEVLMVDTMGEVPLFFAAANVAFVGGTLVPVGGHNLLEPAALGLPIVTGPYVFNMQEIAEMFKKSGASVVVKNAEELSLAVIDFFANSDMAEEVGKRGNSIVRSNRGALERLLNLLGPIID